VLGWHVLTLACRQLARWRTEHPHHRMAVGVNVSTLQLEAPGFAKRVLTLVDEHGIDRDQIVLELTEQSLVVDLEAAATVVAELRAGGLSVAIDDYGTGHSSLSYLHRLAADVIKIDRSFVDTIGESSHTYKIVGSVIHMADSLDLQSIAEGIETYEQLRLVRDLGCELGQGFLFSRPVDASQIGTILEADEATGAAAYAHFVGARTVA
jgi:EAL domain-containing protein (putative c-di-GMP-specific phosphodiesterase class I)